MRIPHCLLRCGLAIGLIALAAHVASAQGLGRRYDFDELEQMVSDSEAVVVARVAGEATDRPDSPSRLVWRVPFKLVRVVKGGTDMKSFDLFVRSPISDLGRSRRDLPETEYVLPLVAFSEGGDEGMRLVADAGFPVGTPEADKILEIVGGRVESTTVIPLRLRLETGAAPYEMGRPMTLTVQLENTSKEPIAYGQAPFVVTSEFELYLPGRGTLIVTSADGAEAPRKPALHAGELPPPPPWPIVIDAREAFRGEINLADYFVIDQPGVYRVTMAVEGPDGKELIRSNTIGLQVRRPVSAPMADPLAGIASPTDLLVPQPGAYQPGVPENGVAGLLRPVSSEFSVGEPVSLELRLINMGDRSVDVDTRLERTLVLDVTEQGESPAVRQMLQHHDWPENTEATTGALAHLRPGAFWGKIINANSLHGKNTASLMEAGRAAVAGAVEPSFEAHGMTLFSFEKPGVYKIEATYQVKPRMVQNLKPWAGQVKTNPIFIRVTPRRGETGAAPLSMP